MKKIVLTILLCFVLCGCGKNNITIDEMMSQFENWNLSVADKQTIENDDLGFAPNVHSEAYSFVVENDMNARLFYVEDKEDLKQLKKYYDDLGSSSSLFYSHTYSKGNYLLQMNGQIAKSTFEKYKKIVEKNA